MEKMRRPAIGAAIVRGLKKTILKTEVNLDHGYYPYDWTPKDVRDVRRSLRYLEDMADYQDHKTKERADARAKDRDENRGKESRVPV